MIGELQEGESLLADFFERTDDRLAAQLPLAQVADARLLDCLFTATVQMLNAMLAGFGLAHVLEDLVQPHLAKGRLKRVLDDWYPSFSG